jgi:hypothetical protein
MIVKCKDKKIQIIVKIRIWKIQIFRKSMLKANIKICIAGIKPIKTFIFFQYYHKIIIGYYGPIARYNRFFAFNLFW